VTGQQHEEIESLAAFIGAQPVDVLALARLVAGDELLVDWYDLSAAGAAEVLANLKLYDTYSWWTREVAD
jgi:hypothetical protein